MLSFSWQTNLIENISNWLNCVLAEHNYKHLLSPKMFWLSEYMKCFTDLGGKTSTNSPVSNSLISRSMNSSTGFKETGQQVSSVLIHLFVTAINGLSVVYSN